MRFRQLKIKKSKVSGKMVNVLTRNADGDINVTQGILKGFLSSDVLVDTGAGLFRHFLMGRAETGRSMILPASMPLRLGRSGNPKPKVIKQNPLDDYVLDPGWINELPAGTSGYGNESYAALDFEDYV
jgi:hypothetical protein